MNASKRRRLSVWLKGHDRVLYCNPYGGFESKPGRWQIIILPALPPHIHTVRVVDVAPLTLDAPKVVPEEGEKINPASLAEVVYPDFIGVFIKPAKRFSTAFQNITRMIVNSHDASRAPD